MVKIGNRILGSRRPVFVVAEAGVNHNGDLCLARQLVRAAVRTGADAVKFQTWKTERLVSASAPKATYQSQRTDPGQTQYDFLQKLELDAAAFQEIQAEAREAGILFLSTPDDEESAELLACMDVPAIKIGSGEVTNLPYLEFVAKLGKPVLLSTGMSTLGEVENALMAMRKAGLRDIVLLHCTSSYPAKIEDANLRAVRTLQQAFRIPVGYSDHTVGLEAPLAATALGAVVIEKHLTLDKSLPGPDHAWALSPEEFRAMVSGIRAVEKCLGDGIKRPCEVEKELRAVARRSVVAASNIAAGTRLRRDVLSLKRPGSGISPAYLDVLVGRTARQEIAKDELLRWEKLF